MSGKNGNARNERIMRRVRKQRPQNPPLIIRMRGVSGLARGRMESLFWDDFLAPPEGLKCALRKTPFERIAIREIVRAINHIRLSLRLPPLLIPIQNVFMVDADLFNRLFPKHESGKGVSGHPYAYVIRVDDRADLVHTLAHEINHLASVAAFLVDATGVKFKDGTLRGKYRIKVTRSGLSISEQKFCGLNEAITETLARMTIEEMASLNAPLPKSVLCEAASLDAYVAQQLVIDRVSKEIFGGKNAGYMLAVWDYLTGTDDFLRTVRKKRPDAIRPLSEMTGYSASARDTAEALGYTDLKRRIERMIKDDAL